MKNIRFLICLVCIIALTFSALIVPVAAVGGKTVTATTSAELKQGYSGTCYVYIDSTESLAALDVAVHFDPAKVKITGVYNSVSCDLYDSVTNTDNIQFSYILDGEGSASKTRLFYFSYQVLSNAELGDTYFDITIGEAYDSALNDVLVSGSRTAFKIIETAADKTCNVYGTSSLSTSVEQEFSLSYQFSTYQIASGSAVINYDPELFEVVEVVNDKFLENKISDINTTLLGAVYISFVGTEYNYYYDFVTIKFKTLKNIDQASKVVFKATELCDKELNSISCNDYLTDITVNYDDNFFGDVPKMSVLADYNAQTEKIEAKILLDADSRLGAGDFILEFNPQILTLDSYEKGFNPSFFNINDKEIADGKLKFSIISMEDIITLETIIHLSFDVNLKCYEQSAKLDLGGNMLSDSLTNQIKLNIIDAEISLPAKHIYSGECDAVCNLCNVSRTVNADHTYTNACDSTCNVCEEVREVPDHIYTNACDTSCNICGSERLVPEHNYLLTNGKVACSVCSKGLEYTGIWQNLNNTYYLVDGTAQTGWRSVEGEWYYFDTETYKGFNGVMEFAPVEYQLQNGKLLSGVWAKTLFGTRYYYGPDFYENGWQNIDGEDYFFENGYRLCNGWQVVYEGGNGANWYYFDANGICQDKSLKPQDGFYTDRKGYSYSLNGKVPKGITEIDGSYYYFSKDGYAQKNGTYLGYLFKDEYTAYTGLQEKDGNMYLYLNGCTTAKGLFEFDGDYYFADWGGLLKTDGRYYVNTSYCDLAGKREYTFGKDGKMLNGVASVDGELKLYINGTTTTKGLFKVNDDYYFADWGGVIKTDGRYYVSTSYCDLEGKREYTFGKDGKMLNGVADVDGELKLYINGTTTTKGLFKVNGDYYFSDWGGVIKTDGKYYVSTSYCDLEGGNEYTFGKDGKMLNGVAFTDGALRLYINGKTTTKGLFKVNGNYYFADWVGVVKTDGRYYVSTSYCDLESKKEYTFGEDGKMLNGIVELDGTLYLYINGTTTAKGLFKVDDGYCFADWGGVIKTDGKYYVSTSYCDLESGKDYTVGADGKLLNGLVEIDGAKYLYTNGISFEEGLHKFDDAYYLVNAGGKVQTSGRYKADKSYCDLVAGIEYTFGDDGKMLNGFVAQQDGIYYYQNGVVATPGIIEVEGDYYFVHTDGKLIVSQTFYVYEGNGYTVCMEYTFNEMGKIIG